MSSARLALAATLLLGFGSVAHANAGTALMWATGFQLYLGNAFVGYGEGWLLSRRYDVNPTRATLVMIVANYVSMWVGYVGLTLLVEERLSVTVYQLAPALLALTGVTFVATVLIEWPFVGFLLRGNKGLLARSLRATLLVQAASYAFLLAGCGATSGTGLLTKVSLDRSSSIVEGSAAILFHIAEQTGDVYRGPLDDPRRTRVGTLGERGDEARLFLWPAESGAGWDLYARVVPGPTDILLASDLPVRAARSWSDENRGGAGSRVPDTWFNDGSASDLRPEDERVIEVRAGFWPVEGIVFRGEGAGLPLWLGFETPFLQWASRSPTVLPGDLTVYQLGPDQIVAVDPHARELTLVARGHGPVVALPAGGS